MHIEKVNDIMRRIEEEHYGVDFGLFLHYEMSPPLHKILRITHVGSHEYHKEHDHYTCAKRSSAAATARPGNSASRCRALDPLATFLSPPCGSFRIRWA